MINVKYAKRMLYFKYFWKSHTKDRCGKSNDRQRVKMEIFPINNINNSKCLTVTSVVLNSNTYYYVFCLTREIS